MTTPEPADLKPWECFYDRSYYDLWAVRLKADRSFNSQTLFHVQSKEEAEALCDILNTRTQPAAPAEDAVEALIAALIPIIRKGDELALAHSIAEEIVNSGYTLRRETMTEAELEAQWLELCKLPCSMAIPALYELAKKYRG